MLNCLVQYEYWRRARACVCVCVCARLCQLEMSCFAEAHGRLAPFWELLGDYEGRVDWREGVKEGGREWKAVVRCKKKFPKDPAVKGLISRLHY